MMMTNKLGFAARMMMVLMAFLPAVIGSNKETVTEELLLPPGIASIWGARMADLNGKKPEIVINVGPGAQGSKEVPRRQDIQDHSIILPPSASPIRSTVEPFPTPKSLNELIVSDSPYEYEDINDQGFAVVDYPLPQSLIQKQLMRLGVNNAEDLEKVNLPFPINLAPAKMFRPSKEKYPAEAEKKKKKKKAPKVRGKVTIIPMTPEEVKTSLWPFANFGDNNAAVAAVENSVSESNNTEEEASNLAPLIGVGSGRFTTDETETTESDSEVNDVTSLTAEISDVFPPDAPQTGDSNFTPDNFANEESQWTTKDSREDDLSRSTTNFPLTPTTPFWIETSTTLNEGAEGDTAVYDEESTPQSQANSPIIEDDFGAQTNDSAELPPLLVYGSLNATSNKTNNNQFGKRKYHTTINVKASTISLMDKKSGHSNVNGNESAPLYEKESLTLSEQPSDHQPIRNGTTQTPNSPPIFDPFTRFLPTTDEPLPNRPRVPDNSAYLSSKTDSLIGYKAGGAPVYRESSNSGFISANQAAGVRAQPGSEVNPYSNQASVNNWSNQQLPERFTTNQQPLAPVPAPPTNPSVFQTEVPALSNSANNYGGYIGLPYSNQALVPYSGSYGGNLLPQAPNLSPAGLAQTVQHNIIADPRSNPGQTISARIHSETGIKEIQQPEGTENSRSAADRGREKQAATSEPRFHGRIGTENVNQGAAQIVQGHSITTDPRLFAPNILEQESTWPPTPPPQATEFSGEQFPATPPSQAIEFIAGQVPFAQAEPLPPQHVGPSLIPSESYELGPDGLPLNVEYCCKEGEPVFPRTAVSEAALVNKDSPFGTWSNGTHMLIQVKPLPFGGATRGSTEAIPASSILTAGLKHSGEIENKEWEKESLQKKKKIKKTKHTGVTGRGPFVAAFADTNLTPPPPAATPAPFVPVSGPTIYGPPGVSPETFAFGLSNFNASEESDLQINQVAISNECFFEKRGCILVNAAPTERRIGISESDCLTFCQKLNLCRAVVYANDLMICDLFPADATNSPSKLVKLQGYTYFEPNGAPGCPETVENTEKEGNVTKPNSVHGAVDLDQNDINSPIPTASPTPAITPVPSPTLDDEPNEFCEDGAEAIFQRAEGWELIGNDGADISPANEAECVAACLSNKTPEGALFRCLSVDYQPDSQTCILSNEAAAPQRFGVLASQENSIYYEKTCLAKEFVLRCSGRDIERHSQRVMRGFGETVESVSNMSSCIELCFQSEKVGLGFKCRSIMFFLEEKSFNCMLNSASHVTEPNFFVTEEANRVEYAGIDNCLSPGAFDRKRKNEPTTLFAIDKPIVTVRPVSERLINRNNRNMEAVKRNFNAKSKPRKKVSKSRKIKSASAPVSGKFKSLNFASQTLLQSMEKKGFLPYDEKILNLLNGPSTDESTSTPVFSTPAILTETVAIDEEESPLMVTGGLRVKSFTIRRSQPQPVLKDTQVETTYRQEKMVQLKHELDYETRKYPEFVDSSNYLFPTTQENVAFIKDGIEHDSVTHQEVVHSARESETVDNSGYAVTSAPLFLRTSSNLPPRNFNDQSDGRVVTLGEWMEWSGCEGSSAGQRKRYIACEAEKFELCPYETEPCEKTGKLTLQKDDVELLSMNMMHDQPIEPTGAVSSSKSSTLATDLSEGSKSEADEFAGPCLPFNGDCRVGVRLLKSGAKQYCLDVDAKLCT